MNPTVQASWLEQQKRRLGEEEFNREYLAQFTDTINGWINHEILNPCVVRGRHELSYLPDASYVAAIDPASRNNDFTLAILHRLPDGMIVIDHLARWAGTGKKPLPFEWVLGEIKGILDDYKINSVVGDQFYCDPIAQHLLKLGVFYKISVFGTYTRAKLFATLKHLLVQRKIELLDDELLLRQLLSLREEKTERGQVDVRASAGVRDDLAIAVALAANEATNRPLLTTVELGIVDRFDTRLRLDPNNCPYAAICLNHPTCVDEGGCLGLKRDENLFRSGGNASLNSRTFIQNIQAAQTQGRR